MRSFEDSAKSLKNVLAASSPKPKLAEDNHCSVALAQDADGLISSFYLEYVGTSIRERVYTSKGGCYEVSANLRTFFSRVY